jgi:protease-4
MADERDAREAGQTWRAPQAAASVPGQPAAPRPPARRRANTLLIVGIIAVLLMLMIGGLMLVVLAVVALQGDSGEAAWGFGDRVGVITISGAISASGEESLWGGRVGGSRSTMSQLRAAAKDDGVKALVLRVNSPGGSAGASQAIAEEVKKLAKKKPVVVSMADVAASGGYWVSAAADKIVANPGTITGSIGVIMGALQYYELMEKVGVGTETLTTGPYKDTGSPWREMRDDERKLMQGMLDNVYEQFIRAVAEGRGMKEGEVRELADGRVFTGEQAKKVKLVDELGNFHDAVELAGKLGKIAGEPKLKHYGSGRGLSEWLGTYLDLQRRRAIWDLLYDHRLEAVESMLELRGFQEP